jgi:3'-phosphoadenosine 5'-phosphosulfate sulfotransferase (PAPS reductase)/FAD synthetase
MAAKGEITPMPKCTIFADTQDEPREVYEYLRYLEAKLPFPIVKVTNGKLSDTFQESFIHIPSFKLKNNGQISIGKRQCTGLFKLRPIYRHLRELGATSKNPIVLWVGITTDEISRVKPARVKYIQNRWPLIELEKNRHWCLSWLKKNGFATPAKSACEYCPLHSDSSWRSLPRESMQRAIAIDRMLTRTRGEYLHPSCVPLEKIDFSAEEERGQLNMFNNECEGMCGV